MNPQFPGESVNRKLERLHEVFQEGLSRMRVGQLLILAVHKFLVMILLKNPLTTF